MATLLLVDDDRNLLELLSMACEDAGHRILTAGDGRSGLEVVKREAVDLVIADVNMPIVDGFTLVRRLREAGAAVPVILLTARDHEVDEALGLELGADDYVAKPYNTRLLLARVAALLRRDQLRGRNDGTPRLQHGHLTWDTERLEVRWRDQLLPMTVSEFRLVEALVRRPGVVLSREKLMDLVRGDDSVVGERIIDTWVRRLRRKFEGADASFDRIDTVVGAGYRWRSDGETR